MRNAATVGNADIVVIRSYDDFQRKINFWLDGTYSHIMVVGRPGVLKSSTIRRHAAELDFPICKGATTPKGFFNTLGRECLGEKLACFDDMSLNCFKSDQGIAVARDATESDGPRDIKWDKHPKPDVIERFTARLCFLCNGFDAAVTRQFEAFADRLQVYHFEPSNRDLLIRAHAMGIGTKKTNSFVENVLNSGRVAEYKLSARVLVKTAKSFRAGDPRWKEECLQMLGIACDDWKETLVGLSKIEFGSKAEPEQPARVRDARQYDEADAEENGNGRGHAPSANGNGRRNHEHDHLTRMQAEMLRKFGTHPTPVNILANKVVFMHNGQPLGSTTVLRVLKKKELLIVVGVRNGKCVRLTQKGEDVKARLEGEG
jgi:hypothetical protein